MLALLRYYLIRVFPLKNLLNEVVIKLVINKSPIIHDNFFLEELSFNFLKEDTTEFLDIHLLIYFDQGFIVGCTQGFWKWNWRQLLEIWILETDEQFFEGDEYAGDSVLIFIFLGV